MAGRKWRAALRRIVDSSIDPFFIEGVQASWASLANAGPDTVAAKIFEIANFQGMSDQAAHAWLGVNGIPNFRELRGRLEAQKCQHLSTIPGMAKCCFKKGRHICANSDLLANCVVRSIPARKGQLAQLAIALCHWTDELPQGGLATWLDTLSKTMPPNEAADSMVDSLKSLPGISDKVASMIASDMAIGLGSDNSQLLEAGTSLVVVDRLVHNILIRSGATDFAGRTHAFGAGCYAKNGCRELVEQLAQTIDARRYNEHWPARAPRMVQHALWRFCAGGELNACNGRNIAANSRCNFKACPASGVCTRLPIQ
tara:strand:+ start:1650 stop:2588 length:939 start_codon:yes stop_codon:yes gene_type:complete